MAVSGGHAGTKKGPNWGHVTNVYVPFPDPRFQITPNSPTLVVFWGICLLLRYAIFLAFGVLFFFFSQDFKGSLRGPNWGLFLS